MAKSYAKGKSEYRIHECAVLFPRNPLTLFDEFQFTQRLKSSSGYDFKLNWSSFSAWRIQTTSTASPLAIIFRLAASNLLFVSSYRPAGIFQGANLHKLSQIFALLEGAGVCPLHKVPDVLIFPRLAAVRTLSARDRQFAMRQVHRRPSGASVAALHAPADEAAEHAQRRAG